MAANSNRLVNFDRAILQIAATDCDTVRRSWIFDAGFKREVAKGKRRKERPDSPWAEKIVRGMIVRGMKTTDSFRFSPLTNIPLTIPSGATQRAHLQILAQKAEIVQPMVGGFFITRNRCKH
jgi:hypothetical protein